MTRLIVLGCGDAFASGGRFCTSFYLNDADASGLIDCGASTLIRMKQLSLDPNELDFIVITHFHGDHYGGLPFFMISSRYEKPREKPLTIFGPQGIKEKTLALQEAMYPGTGSIIDEIQVSFKEYSDDWSAVGDWEVQAFPVKHAPPSNPHGIRMRRGDKVLAYSGDTEWTDNLIKLAAGTEVMICECNNLDKETPGHIALPTLESHVRLLGTKRLLLTHMGTDMLESAEISYEKLEDGQSLEIW